MDNEWEKLKKAYPISFLTDRIAIKDSRNCLKLKRRWLSSLFPSAYFGVLGVGVIIISIVFSEPNFRGIVGPIIFGTLGALFTIPTIITFYYVTDSIVFNKINRKINIKRGLPFFRKVTQYPSSELKVKLYGISTKDGGIFHGGRAILALVRTKDEKSEFVISASKHYSHLESAYENIALFLGQDIEKSLCEIMKLPNGTEIYVPTISLTGGKYHYVQRRSPIISEKTAVYSVQNKKIRYYFLALVAGFLFICLPVFYIDHSDFVFMLLLCGIISLVFFFIGGRALSKLFLKRHFIVDKEKETIEFKCFLNSTTSGKIVCKPEDVAAIQICSAKKALMDGGNMGRFATIYELNLVLKENARRLNLASSESNKQLTNHSKKLNDFLNVPLLEHG
jgi:hypothetical protein